MRICPKNLYRTGSSEHGFFTAGDGLYVSSRHGVTKRTGRLFQLFLSTEQVRPREVVHVGDNPYTDAKMPLSLGIQVQPFQDAQLGLPKRCSLREQVPNPGIASKLAGAMRCFRISDAGQEAAGARTW